MFEPHTINQFELSLNIPGNTDEPEERQALLWRDLVLETADELFTELCPVGMNVTIPSINCSIEAYSQEEFLGKLREELREIISHTLTYRNGDAVTSGSIRTGSKRDFDIFCTFLSTGLLPWYASKTSDRDELFRSVIRNEPEAVRRFFTTVSRSSFTFERVLFQLKRETQKELFAALSYRCETQLQERITTCLHHTDKTNRKSVTNLLSALTSKENNSIEKALRRVEQESMPNNSELSQTSPKAETIRVQHGDFLCEEMRILIEAIRDQSQERFAQVWDYLIAEIPCLISVTLRKVPAIRTTIQHLVEMTTDLQYRQLIEICEPNDSEFIYHVSRTMEKLSQKRTLYPEQPLIREFILLYILEEKSTFFNAIMFVRSIIAQMAAHRNHSFHTLLTQISGEIIKAGEDRYIQSELKKIIEALMIYESAPEKKYIDNYAIDTITSSEELISFLRNVDEKEQILKIVEKRSDLMLSLLSISDRTFFEAALLLHKSVPGSSAIKRKKYRQMLYKSLIPYIVNKKTVNREIFVKTVISELSLDYSLPVTSVLHLIDNYLDTNNSIKLELITESLLAQKRRTCFSPKDTVWEEIERCVIFLTSGVHLGTSPEILNVMEKLFSSKEQLSLLTQRLQEIPNLQEKLFSFQTLPLLKKLFRNITAAAYDGVTASTIIDTIEETAKEVVNGSRFYSAVINKVVQRKAVDIDQLLLESETSVETKSFTKLAKTEPTLLIRWFIMQTENEKLISEQYITVIELLLHHHRELFITLFRSKIKERLFRRKLVENSPTNLLIDLFCGNWQFRNSKLEEEFRQVLNESSRSAVPRESALWNDLFELLTAQSKTVNDIAHILTRYGNISVNTSQKLERTLSRYQGISYEAVLLNRLFEKLQQNSSGDSHNLQPELGELLNFHRDFFLRKLRGNAKSSLYQQELAKRLSNSELLTLISVIHGYHIEEIAEQLMLFTGFLKDKSLCISNTLLNLTLNNGFFSPSKSLSKLTEAAEKETGLSRINLAKNLVQFIETEKITLSSRTKERLTRELQPPVQENIVVVEAPSVYTFPVDKIEIENAGLVLLAPYFPRLFDLFRFVENGEVREECRSKAVHTLQYLVTGKTETPEEKLALNKILCGIPLDEPIERSSILTETEKEQLNGMLTAIKTHWSKMTSSSIETLREMFLQREGTLVREDKQWLLTVAPGTFDMLMQSIPWGYETIKLAWMSDTVFTEW